MAQAARDQNYKTTIIGVSSVDQTTPTLAKVNPATGALLIEGLSLNVVSSIAVEGETPLTGAVTLSEGSNITLTQVGQDIEIASTGGTPGGSDTQVQFNDGGVFGGDSHFYYNKTTDVLHVHGLSGDATDGLLIEAEGGTDIGILGVANTANVTWYGSHNFNASTADTIASFGSSKTLTSLSTATYPSLTELSYVKGVTSSIQTQINAKQATLSGASLTGVTVATDDKVLIQDTSDSNNLKTVTAQSIADLGGGNPGGSDTQVQFNDGGSFGGDAGLAYNKTTDTLTVPNIRGVSSDGSSLTIRSQGESSGDQIGNSIDIIGSNAVTSTYSGGSVFINGGNPGDTGDGGRVELQAADGGATSGSGGSISIAAGSAQAGDSDGGSINISAGQATGNGEHGQANISSGAGNNFIVKNTSVESFVFYDNLVEQSVIFDTSQIATTDKTFTFPNLSGTFALLAQDANFNTLTVNTNLVPDANDGAGLGTTALQFSDLFLASGGQINFANGGITITHNASDYLIFQGATEGYLFSTPLQPSSNDVAALGSTFLKWSDLYLAEGGQINWDNGDATLTQTGNVVLLAGATLETSTVGTSTNSVVTVDGTQTLTNKRITRRSATTNAPGATPTTNTDNVDIQNFTGLNAAITSMTTNLSGTPVDGDKIEFRFLDDGTARAITWGTSFAASGNVALPTTTVISTVLRVGFEYTTLGSLNKWVCVAVA